MANAETEISRVYRQVLERELPKGMVKNNELYRLLKKQQNDKDSD